MSKIPKYANTVGELADIAGIARQNMHKNWLSKDDWPQKQEQGWPVKACLEYMEQHMAQKQIDEGANADLKREKLKLECDVIREKLSILRKDHIPMTEHLREIAEHAAMCKAVFAQWIEQVSAVTRDAGLRDEAKRLRDRALEAMQAAVEGAE